jgi:creatinine amidohydrolase/Fe(II)-dependent formamide hydrolase-like protein
MLVVHPELVKMDEAVPGLADDDVYSPERVRFSQLKAFVEGIDALSPETGVLGDPTGAVAEVGQKLLDFRVKMIVEQLRALDEEE